MSEDNAEAKPFLVRVWCPARGTLTAWDVEPGQQVTAHTPLGVITDEQGTSVPITSRYSGRVAERFVAPGEAVSRTTTLLLLAEARNDQGRDMSKGGPFFWHLGRWFKAAGIGDPISYISRGLQISDGPLIWQWLGGMVHPTEEQLVALATLFKVSEDELEAAREALATFPPTSSKASSEAKAEPKP